MPRMIFQSDVIFSEGRTSNNGSQICCFTYCDVGISPSKKFDVGISPGKKFFNILFILMFYNDIKFCLFWIIAIFWSYDLQMVPPRFGLI